jgi:hypothetical protein
MAELTDSDRQRIREAVAKALMEDDGRAPAATAALAAAAIDPKRLFCDNWETVKAVLQFLKPFLPKSLQGVVDGIIKAGDAVKALICH